MLNMPLEELYAEANKWELSHGGLSGRTASPVHHTPDGHPGRFYANLTHVLTKGEYNGKECCPYRAVRRTSMAIKLFAAIDVGSFRTGTRYL